MSDTTDTPTPAPQPWFGDATYNQLKFVAQIVLPGLATLYAAIAGIWHAPATEAVVGTIVAIDTFLGVLLGISSSQYTASSAVAAVSSYDGSLDVTHTAAGKNFMFKFDQHPLDYSDDKESVSFKINHLQGDDEATTPGVVPPVPPTQG